MFLSSFSLSSLTPLSSLYLSLLSPLFSHLLSPPLSLLSLNPSSSSSILFSFFTTIPLPSHPTYYPYPTSLFHNLCSARSSLRKLNDDLDVIRLSLKGFGVRLRSSGGLSLAACAASARLRAARLPSSGPALGRRFRAGPAFAPSPASRSTTALLADTGGRSAAAAGSTRRARPIHAAHTRARHRRCRFRRRTRVGTVPRSTRTAPISRGAPLGLDHILALGISASDTSRGSSPLRVYISGSTRQAQALVGASALRCGLSSSTFCDRARQRVRDEAITGSF